MATCIYDDSISFSMRVFNRKDCTFIFLLPQVSFGLPRGSNTSSRNGTQYALNSTEATVRGHTSTIFLRAFTPRSSDSVSHGRQHVRRPDACLDGGSGFRLKCILNDGTPLNPKSSEKKKRHFFLIRFLVAYLGHSVFSSGSTVSFHRTGFWERS